MPAIIDVHQKLSCEMERGYDDAGVFRVVAARAQWWAEFAAVATEQEALAAVQAAAPARVEGIPLTGLSVAEVHSACQFTVEARYELSAMKALAGSVRVTGDWKNHGTLSLDPAKVEPPAARSGGVARWEQDGQTIATGATLPPAAWTAGTTVTAVYSHPDFSGELTATAPAAGGGGGSGGGEEASDGVVISCSTSMGTVHVSTSLRTQRVYFDGASAGGDYFNGAINWDGQSAKGVDVQAPTFQISVTKKYPAAQVTPAWLFGAKAAFVGRTNNDAFLGCEAGSLLGTGVNANWTVGQSEPVPVTFTFAYSPSVADYQGTGDKKEGWEYGWPYYFAPDEPVVTGTKRAISIATVYEGSVYGTIIGAL